MHGARAPPVFALNGASMRRHHFPMALIHLTREELFARVWETPLTRVAEQIGITPTGLLKVCWRLEVL